MLHTVTLAIIFSSTFCTSHSLCPVLLKTCHNHGIFLPLIKLWVNLVFGVTSTTCWTLFILVFTSTIRMELRSNLYYVLYKIQTWTTTACTWNFLYECFNKIHLSDEFNWWTWTNISEEPTFIFRIEEVRKKPTSFWRFGLLECDTIWFHEEPERRSGKFPWNTGKTDRYQTTMHTQRGHLYYIKKFQWSWNSFMNFCTEITISPSKCDHKWFCICTLCKVW